MSAHSLNPYIPSIQDSLRALVQTSSVRTGVAEDAIDGVIPGCVVEPGDEAEFARVLAHANTTGLQVAPRGSGTKASWGDTPERVDVALSTARFNRLLEHAHQDMTVTVEAGVKFVDLQRTLAEHGQRLALDPMWPERATVGGAISTNDCGALRLRYGGVRDLIIGVTIVLSDGTIAKSGGKVVKNVAGYDLPKLMTGAFGTLGVITKAVFRLHPLPEHARTISLEFADIKGANNFMLAVADSTLVPTGMQFRIGNGIAARVDVRFEGIAPSIEAQTQTLTKLASNARECTESTDVWRTREQLSNPDGAIVCKLSMLPSEIGATAAFLRETLAELVPWSFVAQSVGLAVLRIESSDEGSTREVIASLRAQLARSGGFQVILACPAEWKKSLSVWGSAGSAQALMKRIKQRFDPKGTLNRGRFVGGI